jgi:hypothetical protein
MTAAWHVCWCAQRNYARHSFAHMLRLESLVRKLDAERDHDGSLLRAGALFPNASGVSLKDSEWASNKTLSVLGGIDPKTKKWMPQKPFPLLSSVDVSGCQGVSSLGLRALIKGLGDGLRGFKQQVTAKHSRCKEMRVTDATIKVNACLGSPGPPLPPLPPSPPSLPHQPAATSDRAERHCLFYVPAVNCTGHRQGAESDVAVPHAQLCHQMALARPAHRPPHACLAVRIQPSALL